MKLLSNNNNLNPLRTVGPGGPGPNDVAAARAAQTRRPRLPRDAYVALSNNPTELHINLTITRMEHIEALIEALQTFAPQIEYGRQRDEDR